jgi:hypothetical protein
MPGVSQGGAVDAAAEMFARRVAEQGRRLPGYRTAWRRFARVLLSHGGKKVVPPIMPDLMIDVFRTRGRLWSSPARLVEGEVSACHDNAVALWRSGEASAVGTGYALSDDGLWREHTWAVVEDGGLLETTEPRTAYFGVELRGRDAERFARWIDGGPAPPGRRTFGYSRLPRQLGAWIAWRWPGGPSRT